MKKICVSTYCEWSSYGSVLQSFGLKSALSDLGCGSFIVKDNPEPQEVRLKFLKSAGSFGGLIKNVLDMPFCFGKKQVCSKGLNFIRQNLNVKYYDSYDRLRNTPPAADCYIAGSDQIWHPALCKNVFFLDFAPKDSKKISYAASMGVTDIPFENKEKFSTLIKNIDSYSVREKEIIPIVKSITGREPTVNIDPTFLVSGDRWRCLQLEYKIRKPYILVYAIYWDKSLNAQLKKLHKKTGLPIVSIQSSFRNIYSNKILSDVGPAEFLWLVDNAEAVITSSFHGTAFSVIFNKKFSTVINPNAKSRISSLLNVLDIKTPSVVDVIDEFNIDYNSVKEIINKEREKSLEYLRSEIFENQ